MAATTKTKKGRFTPWCWEAERDEYNDESRRGWHLSKRTLRDMTYEYAPEKQYRYAIDYQHWHNEDMYLELFELDGWELVGTVTDAFDSKEPGSTAFSTHWEGCWYIFRKKYDPGQSDTEYEIVTDSESIRTFRRLLKRKYLFHLAIELAWVLLWVGNFLHGASALRLSSLFTLSVWILCAFSTVFDLLCVTVLRPRKVLRMPYIPPGWLRGIVIAAIFLLLSANLLAANRAEEAANTVPVTAENTPVQLFLELRPDITADEVMELAEECNLVASESYRQRYDQTGELIFDNYTIQLLPDSDLEYDRGNSLYFFRGVAMALGYDPDTMELQSAYLSIDTDDGRAYCHYFPGEPTMENCETGYNLFLRKSALSRQRYYHAETPEEIIAIAYPVLYPDGLE